MKSYNDENWFIFDLHMKQFWNCMDIMDKNGVQLKEGDFTYNEMQY